VVTQANDLVKQSPFQRILLAEDLVRNGCDPRRVVRELGWQEFEEFIENALRANDYRTIRHFVFKYKRGRREIDLLAWNHSLTLAIDCKHWVKATVVTARLRQAVTAQKERVEALASQPGLLRRYNIGGQGTRSLMPVVLMLSYAGPEIVAGVPVVSVSKFEGFLQCVSPFRNEFMQIPIRLDRGQTKLK
jgi:Holliday junction resolvase-like predicted endonuclease